MTRPFSLYIHVPFCARKCPYCDFNTYAVERVPEEQYVEALLRELRLYAEEDKFSGRAIRTVFFGGGTPSLLSPKSIGSVLEAAGKLFGVLDTAEITLEANPSLSSLERFKGFKSAGVNRVSFGAQSFSSRVLELLGRDHVAGDITSSVEQAAVAGIENQSIDIIFGVPGQSVSELASDMELATSLPIRHVSTYALTIERGTPFFQRQERGLLALPADEVVADMLEWIPEFLSSKGFLRYEISNYAKPDWESQHNLSYWLGHDYLGLGAGAHSFVAKDKDGYRVAGLRWSNKALPAEYQRSVVEGPPVSWRETLDKDALGFEFFYLGLRRTEGVGIADFESLFGEAPSERYLRAFDDLQRDGFLEHSKERVRLTQKGINLSDSVFEQLVGRTV